MAQLAYLVLALCAMQVSAARVATTTTKTTTQAPVDDFFKNVTEFGKKVQKALTETHESVVKSLGFQSNQEVIETLQNGTHKYVEQLRTIHTTLQKEAEKHSDLFEPVVKDLNAKLAETTKKFSEQKPEFAQKAKEYQEAVQSNIQSLVSEAQKAGERLKEESRGATEQLQSALKQLFDLTVQNLQETVRKLEAKKDKSA
ncbi:uncharacterized protein LOC128743826 [Sabethes cyaneus]|uniref:uncharacterized protein LOC128743826 n=1 Tax=Sabethes cyaneus TaxID=53552 RepID=UPI00237D4BA8|nr:uncharacterized protein LOC128743826 [Sabethes cyaneus]